MPQARDWLKTIDDNMQELCMFIGTVIGTAIGVLLQCLWMATPLWLLLFIGVLIWRFFFGH